MKPIAKPTGLAFYEWQLPSSLHQGLKAMGFENPTPIQAQGIPVVLERRDLIACAQTGTGKTGAFSIPLIARLLRNPAKMALILTPTRELAAKVESVVEKLTKFSPELKCALLIDGASMQPQLRALSKHPRIIIATPGRLTDHLHRGSISLSQVEILVLDEADRMLDMGFAPQLNEILRFLPKTRQTLLFSATFPIDIQKMAKKFLKDPVEITVTPEDHAQWKEISKLLESKAGALPNVSTLKKVSKAPTGTPKHTH